jgi:hypothetical protein
MAGEPSTLLMPAARCRRTEGLACVLGTAVCWIAASFISQALVRPGAGGAPPRLPAPLLCYICTSLFSLYLPAVPAARALQARWRRRQHAGRSGGNVGRAAAADEGAAGAPLLPPAHLADGAAGPSAAAATGLSWRALLLAAAMVSL